jgi:hypothetical protein
MNTQPQPAQVPAPDQYCFMEKRVVSPDECTQLSSRGAVNRDYCRYYGCESPERRCLSCASHGEIDPRHPDETRVIAPGRTLCQFHNENGYMTRRDDNDASEERLVRQMADAQARAIRNERADSSRKKRSRKKRTRAKRLSPFQGYVRLE